MNGKKIFMVLSVCFLVGGFALSRMAAGQAKTPAKPPAKAETLAKIDLNKATAEQIGKCPGVTPALAKAIVEYREKSGPFKSPEDLLKVKGITKEILNKIKPKMDKGLLYVTPAPPASDEDEEEPSLKPSKC
jgi:competence ComEA-like helix-hairpin-helix protein